MNSDNELVLILKESNDPVDILRDQKLVEKIEYYYNEPKGLVLVCMDYFGKPSFNNIQKNLVELLPFTKPIIIALNNAIKLVDIKYYNHNHNYDKMFPDLTLDKSKSIYIKKIKDNYDIKLIKKEEEKKQVLKKIESLESDIKKINEEIKEKQKTELYKNYEKLNSSIKELEINYNDNILSNLDLKLKALKAKGELSIEYNTLKLKEVVLNNLGVDNNNDLYKSIENIFE